MQLPSITALQIMAHGDQALFEHTMATIGLPVMDVVNRDPILGNQTSEESVSAIASFMAESNDELFELCPELDEIRKFAEAMGYVVGIDREAIGS